MSSYDQPSTIPLDALDGLYSLREPQHVHEFLGQRPSLVSLLVTAVDPIRHVFPDGDLVLAVVIDPEGSDTQLMLTIVTELSPSIALDKLRTLDEQWWLGKSDEAQGDITLKLEFQ